MTGSEELRATHLALSAVDWKFRELARSSEECLRRSTYRILDQKSEVLLGPFQSWPTFVSREWLRDFERISRGIASLIRSIPRRIFDSDPVRIAEFFKIEDPQYVRNLLTEPDGIDALLSRGDFIDTHDGMKCIEFNFSSNLGGWETGILQKMHLGIAPTSRFIAEQRLAVSATSTIAILFDHALAQALDRLGCRDEEINAVFLIGADVPLSDDSMGLRYLEFEYSAACRRRGVSGRVLACHIDGLSLRRDLLFHGDLRIHVVIEYFMKMSDQQVYRAFKGGSICLLNGPVAQLLNNKRNVALLSEQADSRRFSTEERELIERHVPWTRQVRAGGYVTYRGERESLPDLLISQREHLVLKDPVASGGKGVALGRVTPPEAWERLAEKALARGDWVVQEALESRPYLYQCGDHGCAPHDVIWGPFVFGDQYAGVVLRMQPQAERSAVNLSLAATQGVVFEV